jgi:hypothetical protein
MGNLIDISGHTYNGIKVISYSHTKVKTYWNCVCHCGKKIKCRANSLRTGHVKSCGCTKSDSIRKFKIKHGELCYGQTSTKEYSAWHRMIQRCVNPKSADYKRYGHRGIKVCNRWINSFQDFLKDMGRSPSKDHSIDRIDNNGNYEPSNCRWATHIEQINNRSSTVFVTYDGLTLPFSVFCKQNGLKYGTAKHWHTDGMSPDEMINRHRQHQGKPHHRSTFSILHIHVIREALNMGYSLGSIGRYFKTTKGTIWKIKSGYSWRSV